MAKAKTIYIYLLCFFVCSSLAGQDYLSSKRAKLQQVEHYLAAVGFAPGYAWCAAFVSWCYQQVDVQHPQSAWVPSYSKKQNLIYQRGQFIKQLPRSGDVFMIWFDRLNRPAHIGFVDEWKGHWVTTVEGNTNDDGSREGDGVYRKRRLKRQVWAVSNFIGD